MSTPSVHTMRLSRQVCPLCALDDDETVTRNPRVRRGSGELLDRPPLRADSVPKTHRDEPRAGRRLANVT